MKRIVEPEILDTLAEDDPEALHNRRDLRRFNVLMGNFRWFVREVARHTVPEDRLLEVGAGTGELARHLVKSDLCGARHRPVTGIDLWSRPAAWPAEWEWRRENLLQTESCEGFSVVLANMVLHQFEDRDLARLGSLWSSTARVILACETARRRLHLEQLRLAPVMGVNRVTKHDARVSVRAGFLGEELPAALGLDSRTWQWTCHCGLLGQYRMVAIRRNPHSSKRESDDEGN